QQKADFAQAKAEDDNAIRSYLWDETDEQARKTVKTAGIAKTHAQAQLDQRIIRASANGTTVQPGTTVATIFQTGAKPQAWAYLPASDLPRIKKGMLLEVAIEGFKKKRAKLKILDISQEGIGVNDVRKSVGQGLSDTLKLPND